MKRCNVCDQDKSLDNFYSHPTSPDGLRYQCKQCTRDQSIARRFGLDVLAVKALVADQGGLCAICQKPLGDKFCIDHDHDCCPSSARTCGNCIRSALCFACNTGLGNLGDSSTLLRAAADYLDRHKGQNATF